MRLYTEEQYEWLRDNCHRFHDFYGLHEAFVQTFGFGNLHATKSICRRNGFKHGGHSYTEEEIQWMFDNVSRLSMKEFGEEFRRRFNSTKDDASMRSYLNKHGYRFCDFDRHRQLRRDINHYPIGYEIDRGGRVWVKVKDDLLPRRSNELLNYRPKAIIEYERLNGTTVPKGKFVTFLDGDTHNFSKENLVMVDRRIMAKLSKMESFKEHPVEHNRTRVMICELELMAKEDDRDGDEDIERVR